VILQRDKTVHLTNQIWHEFKTKVKRCFLLRDKMNKILVFPCGSEIGLEIYRSMKFSRHFHLIGGSSVDDHGRFVFKDYVGGIPFHNEPDFIQAIADIVKQRQIDAIYPAMDDVAVSLKKSEHILGCRVIGSSVDATVTCASKGLTYTHLYRYLPVPTWCSSIDDVHAYPVFIKPDVGYGSRNVYVAKNENSARVFIETKGLSSDFVFCEYLPGPEYTIDCFTNRHGELMFSGARLRNRISNGISTNTREAEVFGELFQSYAQKINSILCPRGAWFFQMKLDVNDSPKLLEVAIRLGGSSSLFRAQGVNFALLSTFDAFDIDVSIVKNSYSVELDRALSNKYSLNIEYHTIYLDYDDCLLIGTQINIDLIKFIFSAINSKKKIILITRHAGDIYKSLANYRIAHLFDKVIHLVDKKERKSKYILSDGAIFIDDSHAERLDVLDKCQIPVFSPEMVEMLT